MRKNMLFPVLLAAVFFSSCAPIMKVHIPKESPLFEIKELKGVPEIHARTILFVNKASSGPEVNQRCLVFEGTFSYETLFREGSDGLPQLKVLPVGYFGVKASYAHSKSANEKLVGLFEPGRGYTILCFLENPYFDSVVDIKTMYVTARGSAKKEVYKYFNSTGMPQWKFVNKVVYLPRYNPSSPGGSKNTFSFQVDLNDLLRRLLRTMFGPSGSKVVPTPEPERKPAPEPSPSPADSIEEKPIRLRFPSMADSTTI